MVTLSLVKNFVTVIGEEAKQVRNYLECTTLSWHDINTCANSSAGTVYLMSAKLGHSHFNLRNIMQLAGFSL